MKPAQMDSVQRRAYVGGRILEALTQNGIHALMMLAYEVFDAPILLGDINSRVIFQYPLTAIGDAVYDTMLQHKVIEPQISDQYIRECGHDKYDLWEPMYVNEGLVAGYPRLYGVVRYYGIKQAVLAIFLGEKPLREDDFELVKMFTNALEVKFKKDIKGNLEWIPPTAACLQDILEPTASSHLKCLAQRTLSENLTGEFALMVTNIGRTERQKNFAFHAVSDMMGRYRNLVSVIFGDKLVTLFGEMSLRDFHPHNLFFIKELTSKLYAYKLASGISCPFSNLALIPGYYQQAHLVAQMAEDQPSTPFLYSNDVSERLIFREATNSPAPYIFLHPLFAQLQAYDRQNNTVYFQTLRAYCLAFFDKDDAAAMCCAHRNTLVYRLNKLTEIFRIDLRDEKLRRELYCGFLLLDETGGYGL